MTRVRCAIYTRKSTEEGLEQEFNTLDAQYDACKSYIASQRHEGWSLVRERYDDGGYSGASMERPGLARLLADVAAGRIDVIVIYKVDRLTRSLSDFARIIEVLEKADASFVSVTQSFNTSTSMGRLMLHVLLSFAQFEREVGSERVRDKIAASKAKGLWTGGTVPLGYDAVDKKLVVNEKEAATVRSIFGKFVQLKSVIETLEWTRQQDLRTKLRQRQGGTVGGAMFQYGSLRCVLSNRTYAGEVDHKGKVFPGQQQPIVVRETFEEAQRILATLGSAETRRPKLVSNSLLQGIIVDRHQRHMGPVHSTRNGQRFRYYVTHPKTLEKGGPAAYRLAADDLERRCCELLVEHLGSQVTSVDGKAELQRVAATLTDGPNEERRRIIRANIRAITIGDAELTMELVTGEILNRGVDRVRHGNDVALIVGPTSHPQEPKPDRQLLILLRDAHRAQALAIAKPKLTLQQLAAKFGRSPERYKRLLRLSYLSPTIVTTVLEGTQPERLTNRFLQNLDGLPLSWPEQEQRLLALGALLSPGPRHTKAA
jgi:DNA invertase Pin-like site-specific DNA recombinase